MAAPLYFFVLTNAFLLMNTYATTTQKFGVPSPFGYSGAMGPNKWGSLSPNFSACSNGIFQSPIDIVKDKVVLNKNLKPLTRQYYPANATLIDNGFNIGVHYEGNAGVMIFDGKTYHLIQMHWHSPSEHRIHGVRYAAELHLVHKGDDASISVVAVLYRYGPADPLVHEIQNKLGELAKEVSASHEHTQISLGTFHTTQLTRRIHKYYKYVGSFTTPPCSPNVTWLILSKVRSISREQIEALKTPLNLACKNNSRPLQALHGRKIEEYDGHSNR